MERFEGRIALAGHEVINVIMSNYDYKNYKHSGKIQILRRACRNTPALIDYDNLPHHLKAKVHEVYGDPVKILKKNQLTELITPDYSAAKFFKEYLTGDETGLTAEKQTEYAANATVLNAVGRLFEKETGHNKRLSVPVKGIWTKISDLVNTLDRSKFPHTLPQHPDRLKEKYQKYAESGYDYLIHKGFGNQNTRKVNEQIEKLIISLYCAKNLPFANWVHDDYLQFIAGNLDVVDRETGILYDREDFIDEKKKTYIMISKATVWNIIHNPINAIIIDRLRNNRIDHITQNTPYNRRTSPQMSLMKITADDRTLPRRTTDGKKVNCYYIMDVASQAYMSAVYTTNAPDVDFVWDCFREFYRTVDENNLMWPAELECENHLMRSIEKELQAMFTYVTFTQPGVSRGKRAEHFIRGKKYTDEKKHQVGVGRWNSKGAYKTKSENKDEEYKQPRLPLEQIIAEDRESIERYNHGLHPNQKRYKGMTRWQVLTDRQGDVLTRPEHWRLMRYLGRKTETSIRNNDFCTVQYEPYLIDNYYNLKRLKPNNYEVTAYYLPEVHGGIKEVYMYQGDTFISRATLAERYNEAKAERTERDEQIRTNQAKRHAKFFKMEKDGLEAKVNRNVEVVRKPVTIDLDKLEVKIIDIPEPEPENLDERIEMYMGQDWAAKAHELF